MKRFYAAAALLPLLALCLASPVPAQAEPRPLSQPVIIRVLDADDLPVEGAVVDIKALQGQPLTPGPYRTDYDGELRILWAPGQEEIPVAHSRDTIREYKSDLRFMVGHEGMLPIGGALTAQDVDRTVRAENLDNLSRRARLRPLTAVVRLLPEAALMGGELAGLGPDDPRRRALVAFYRQYNRPAQLLGCELDIPAFELKNGLLSLRLRWRHSPWQTLDLLPPAPKLLVACGLPMAVAAGQGLTGPGGPRELAVVIADSSPPEDDPHAMPKDNYLVLSGPAVDFAALAKGTMDAVAFLDAHPPLASVP